MHTDKIDVYCAGFGDYENSSATIPHASQNPLRMCKSKLQSAACGNAIATITLLHCVEFQIAKLAIDTSGSVWMFCGRKT